MKDNIKLIIFLLSIILSPIVCYKLVHFNERRKNGINQIGVYKLDINKTKLGGYLKDSNYYKKLQIEFKKDMTFEMTFNVPFVFDSSGTWLAATDEPEDWSRIYYNKKIGNNEIYDQFSSCRRGDSIFYISGTAPKVGEEAVPIVYFKKIK